MTVSRKPAVRCLTTDEIQRERNRCRKKKKFWSSLISVLTTLLIIAGAATLDASVWLPVLRIHNDSMAPVLSDGNLVLALQHSSIHSGDLIAFYSNNKILVRRVIAGPGDEVDIASDGSVCVNGVPLEEGYASNLQEGVFELDYPYLVPDDRWFVLSDDRSVVQDSRIEEIGCVAEELILGQVIMKIWPLNEMEVYW